MIPSFASYTTPLAVQDFCISSFSRHRSSILPKILSMKRARRIQLGPHLSVTFEHKILVWFQIQEMLFSEKRTQNIDEEIEAYNPLVPRPGIIPITLMWEYTDPEERSKKLIQLRNFISYLYIEAQGVRYFAQPLPGDTLPMHEKRAPSVNFLCFKAHSNPESIHIHDPEYTADTTIPQSAWSFL